MVRCLGQSWLLTHRKRSKSCFAAWLLVFCNIEVRGYYVVTIVNHTLRSLRVYLEPSQFTVQYVPVEFDAHGFCPC